MFQSLKGLILTQCYLSEVFYYFHVSIPQRSDFNFSAHFESDGGEVVSIPQRSDFNNESSEEIK